MVDTKTKWDVSRPSEVENVKIRLETEFKRAGKIKPIGTYSECAIEFSKCMRCYSNGKYFDLNIFNFANSGFETRHIDLLNIEIEKERRY